MSFPVLNSILCVSLTRVRQGLFRALFAYRGRWYNQKRLHLKMLSSVETFNNGRFPYFKSVDDRRGRICEKCMDRGWWGRLWLHFTPKTGYHFKTEERLLIFSGATLKDTYVAKNVAIRPENSSSEQNPRFTSLSEMTSIPDLFTSKSSFSSPHTPFHMGVPRPHPPTHTPLHIGGPTHPRTSKGWGA